MGEGEKGDDHVWEHVCTFVFVSVTLLAMGKVIDR